LHRGHALGLIAQTDRGDIAIGIEAVMFDDFSGGKIGRCSGRRDCDRFPLRSATVFISGRTINDNEGFTPIAASILMGIPSTGERTVASAEVV